MAEASVTIPQRPKPTHSQRGEQTRRAILDAAEDVFAHLGFAAARLEDVAERVGIRRASIVPYYRDKNELYEAVLGDLLGDLLARIEPILRGPHPLVQRAEDAVSSWIDFLNERPTMARLLLREVADAAPDRPARLVPLTRPIVETIEEILREGLPGDALAEGSAIDPAHVASTVAGATIFFAAAMPVLVSEFNPRDPQHLAAHRREVLGITRRLLGVSDPGSG